MLINRKIAWGITLLALLTQSVFSAPTYNKNNEKNDVIPLAKKKNYIHTGTPQGSFLDTGHFIRNGQLWVWGYMHAGAGGNGINTPAVTSIAKPVETVRNVIDMVGGIAHVIVLDANGDVWSWGYNAEGSTGHPGYRAIESLPNKVLSNAVAIAAGEYSSMALDRDGKIYTWGDNRLGELGIDSTKPRDYNKHVINGFLNNERGVIIGATYEQSYAITFNPTTGKYTVWGWGDNEAKGLGQDTPGNLCLGYLDIRRKPVKMTTLDAYAHRITQISGGNGWGAALLENGDVIGWGSRYSLGQGDTNTLKCTKDPIYILKDKKVEQMYARFRGGVALTRDNKLYTWGESTNGSGAHDFFYGRTVTLQSNVVGTPISIGGGKEHIYYVNSDGEMYGVGYNAYGQTNPSNRPYLQKWPGSRIPITEWVNQYHGR